MTVTILTDTIWDVNNGPALEFGEDVIIAEGATLLITDGYQFNNSNINFSVYGDLSINGAADNSIDLLSSRLNIESTGSLSTQFVYMGGGMINAGRDASVNLKESHFDKVSQLSFANANIKGNIFEQSSTLEISQSSNEDYSISSNEFFFQNGIRFGRDVDVSRIDLSHNAFYLANGQYAYEIEGQYGSPIVSPLSIDISNNFFSIDPQASVDDFILDHSNKQNVLYLINLVSTRSEHTPSLTVMRSGDQLDFGRDVASLVELISENFRFGNLSEEANSIYPELSQPLVSVAEGEYNQGINFFVSGNPFIYEELQNIAIISLDENISDVENSDLSFQSGGSSSSGGRRADSTIYLGIQPTSDPYVEGTEFGWVNVSFYADYFLGGEFRTSFDFSIIDGPVTNSPVEGEVQINGTVAVGKTVAAVTTGLSDKNGLGDFSFQWFAGSNKIPIDGATSDKFVIPEALLYQRLSVNVSYVDNDGFDETAFAGVNVAISDTSPPDEDNEEVPDPRPTVPINYAPEGIVVLTGSPYVGRELQADFSNLSDPNGFSSNSVSISWLSEGKLIEGETAANLRVSDAMVGKSLTARIAYTDNDHFAEEVVSLPVKINSYDGIDLPVDKVIKGSAGIDVVNLLGDQSNYTLFLGPDLTFFEDRFLGRDSETFLFDIEIINFDSGAFDLRQFGGATGLSERDFESFIELYISHFNRAPDAVGLNFWGTAFANGTNLEEMAALFADQDETWETYPSGTTNKEFAESVYNNLFGRTPDQVGFEFWVGHLDAGNTSRDQFILEVLRGVQPGSPDRSYLDVKVDIGTYFAVIRGMSDVDDGIAAMELFDGTQGSILDAVATIDSLYAEALDPSTGEFLMPLIGVLDDPFAVA